jgi:hypothetical protein
MQLRFREKLEYNAPTERLILLFYMVSLALSLGQLPC